jgi:hypothetical protein
MDHTDPNMVVSSHSLLVVSGQAKGAVIPIPLGELLIGRETSRTGRLGGDPLLSRRHARITNNGQGQVVLEDLASTNGTLLNGARITSRRPIHTSDVIEVGGSKLQVLGAADARDTARKVRRPALADGEPMSSVWPMFGADEAVAPDVLVLPPPGPPPGDHARRNLDETAPERLHGDRSPPHASRRGRATVEGQIRGIQQRVESHGELDSSVWTFRIERYDRDGNRLPPIPVQMRGIAFEGSLSEGDEIKVVGVWKAGTLYTERVQNITTGATVKAKSHKWAYLIIALIVLAGFITFAVYSQRQYQQRVDRQDQNYQQEVDRQTQKWCQQAKQYGMVPPGC